MKSLIWTALLTFVFSATAQANTGCRVKQTDVPKAFESLAHFKERALLTTDLTAKGYVFVTDESDADLVMSALQVTTQFDAGNLASIKMATLNFKTAGTNQIVGMFMSRQSSILGFSKAENTRENLIQDLLSKVPACASR